MAEAQLLLCNYYRNRATKNTMCPVNHNSLFCNVFVYFLSTGMIDPHVLGTEVKSNF